MDETDDAASAHTALYGAATTSAVGVDTTAAVSSVMGTVASSGVPQAATPDSIDAGAAVAVHSLSLGIDVDDADDDLLHRDAMDDVTTAVVAASTASAITNTGSTTTTITTAVAAAASELPQTIPTVPGTHPNASVSAVYRFYEIETTLSLKRREESSIARCRLCRQEGKQERKSCVRFSKSVTSNLWRHLKENHPLVYEKHVGEKKQVQMHKMVGAGKRGRKKKPVVATAPQPTDRTATSSPSAALTTSSSRLASLEDSTQFLEDDEPASGTTNCSSTVRPRATKRARRQSPSDQFFTEYALTMGGGAIAGGAARVANLDRVREAAAYMCVREMVPFDLCSSMAFRNLLNECQGGFPMTTPPSGATGRSSSSTSGTLLLEDATTVASVIGRQAVLAQSKKLIEAVHERVAAQLKSVESVHLQVVEWPAANALEPQLVGVFAVTLDHDFNLVRRCLCVVPVPVASSEHNAHYLEHSALLTTALLTVPQHKYVPNLIAVEPSQQHHYASLFAAKNLHSVESVTSLLREIMMSTITGVAVSHAFLIGAGHGETKPSAPLPEETMECSFGRAFDSAQFVESVGESNHNHARAILSTLCSAEIPSSILTELPNVLTGHTIRDILLKVLHLVAHIKQSKHTRVVMRAIMVTEFRMDAEVFSQLFEKALRALTVGVHCIYDVLTLTLKMTPTLQRYFELHKDGTTDLSKLMQLASLSAYEWERVGYLASLLKPFAEAVEKLQHEKYVASSLIIPSVFTLLEKLRAPSACDGQELPEDIVALKSVASARLAAAFGYLFAEPDEAWSSTQRSSFNWLWSATLLDPRTRPFILKGALTATQFWDVVKAGACEISGMNKLKEDRDAQAELNGLHEHTLGGLVDDTETEAENETVATANGGPGGGALGGGDGDSTGRTTGRDPLANGSDLWDDLQANLASCAQEELLLTASKSTLELTKSTNLLEVEISFLQDESRISLRANPLEWWHSMRVKYPYVARLARYVLSIPASCPLEENPMRQDAGLVRRLVAQMPMNDVCALVATSLNLRLESHAPVAELSSREMWSTV